MNKNEAHDIFQRVRLVMDYIDDQPISYPKTVSLRALREVAMACQEAMVERSNDADRCDTEIKKPPKVAESGGYLAG
jgi:hypothetical protein